MNSNEHTDQDIFKTGISISEPVPWFASLARQFRQKREDRLTPHVEVTSKPDLTVLDKFVKGQSLITSIVSTARGIFSDRHRVIQTSAAPVEVQDLWSKESHGMSGLLSLGVHALFIGALIVPSYLILRTPPLTSTSVLLGHEQLILPELPKVVAKSGGGGGGGMKTPTPPSKGQLPRGADKQIVPPMVEAKNLAPDLVVETTVIAPQLANIIPLPNIPLGDLNGVVGPPSAGPGRGGGIGTGEGTGIGSGKGPGVGPGEGGGIGGGAFSVGGGVSEPVPVSMIQPEYSDDGRKARVQGTVVLSIVVNPDGTVRFDNVSRSLGYGLDQKAIEAVRKWKFIAGKKDGKPVPVRVEVLVNFSLR